MTALETSNPNIAVGARKGKVPDIFTGNFLGTEADFVFEYRTKKTKALKNIVGDYHVARGFFDKVSLFIVKNYLADHLPAIKIPVILGIWGGKGEGKSFQTELTFKAMGIEPVIISAGELESKDAGAPAKLIRQRYLEASNVVKAGKMCVLMINDMDAGIGRFGVHTQYTVNQQMVCGTLMNIADNPTNVQMSEYSQAGCNRVPIIVTGNDLSILYAPLIRDGRMEKYYWAPTYGDRVEMCYGMFKDDGLSVEDVASLVSTFKDQSMDFYGALRSKIYDESIRAYVDEIGVGKIAKSLCNSKTPPPQFVKPDVTLDFLMRIGKKLEEEQGMVQKTRLHHEYFEYAF